MLTPLIPCLPCIVYCFCPVCLVGAEPLCEMEVLMLDQGFFQSDWLLSRYVVVLCAPADV